MPTKINLFIAYAPEDEALKEQLEKHLAVLKRQQFIEIWHNRRIEAGADWSQKISSYLDTAQIILLLISPDFLASDYLYQTELKAALKKHYGREATVLPILLRPCLWQIPELEMLTPLPLNQKAVTDSIWKDTDEAFQQIAEEIKKEAMQYLPLQNTKPAQQANQEIQPAPTNNKKMLMAGLAILLLLAVLFLVILNPFSATTTSNNNNNEPNQTRQETNAAPTAKTKTKLTLDISAAAPITLAPGDFQYEREYSVVKGNVQDIGGGSNLITLTVGFNYKGILNDLLEHHNFRLIAPELKGEVAPSNFFNELVDSKEYKEHEVKFELSNTIRKFSVVIEGKDNKKWDFSMQ